MSFCREESLGALEGLEGSANAGIRRWLVVETRTPWGAKTPRDAGLETEIRDFLIALPSRIPGTRVQLVRRSRPSEGPWTVYWAATEQAGRGLWRKELGQLSELLSLDLQALENEPACKEPLFLVCTHGVRDACCAKWGLPMFEALCRTGASVWQTSHLGGHRFAPIVLALPAGALYGRLEPAEAGDFVAAHRDGELYRLDRLRGLSEYQPREQVGELALRRRAGEKGRRIELAVLHRSDGGACEWQLGDESWCTEVAERELPAQRRKSCGDQEPCPARRWELLRCEQLKGGPQDPVREA